MENNKEQKRAIETIDRNLSVIAGAGTGKTKVLTERFVHILENGNLPLGREVESIVAITFTKKASQEMIERIRREIRKNFTRGEKWRGYYRDIEKANISTIHSFCLNILKENAVRADLDPMFEVIEEYESRKMLTSSILEALTLQLEEDPLMYELLKMMKLDRVEPLAEDIKSVYNQIRTIGISIERVREITIKHLESLEAIDLDDLDRIRKLVYILIEKGSKAAKIKKLLDDEKCRSFLEGERVDDLSETLAFIEGNIGSNKKEQENIDLLTSHIRKALRSLERENIDYYKTLFKILERVDISYESKKDVFGGLDYEDLQIKTNKLLKDKSVLAKYQDRYRYIMIDEFQDTNELQKQIFYKIATVEKDLDRDNLFIVGDPKQSIYGFRGADLDVFYQVTDYIDTTNGGAEVKLNKNYRTVDTVVNFVNNIFSQLMKKKYSALNAAKESKEKIDVELISDEELLIPDGVSPSEYERNFEAEQIAKRIRELVNNGQYRYKDFAMLFRATTRNHIYERALNKYGVPYYNIGSKGFFKQQEVVDIINALRSVNNINDKISTIGFLRSNFIGLDDNAIYHIFKDPKADVYESIDALRDEDLDKTETVKLNQALDIYREMKIYRHAYGLNQILFKLLNKSFYIQTTLLKENARQKFANIQKIVDIARQYEDKYTGNLNEFLDYIDEIRENDESMGQIESDNTDALKILTIHKSKGLEFPVVIIPEMSSRGYTGSSKFLIGEENKLAINFGKSNPIYNEIKKDQSEKEREEMKRVLYVAMTRAEEKIILGIQGKKTGFKAMVIDLMDVKEYKSLGQIDIEEDKKDPVKLIAKKLEDENIRSLSREEEEKVRGKLPILYSIEDYDRGFNPRVSISKYMVFRDCRRKYFLENNINVSSIESAELERQVEAENKIVENSLDKDLEEQESEILDPITKGNIVHAFCEIYRYGKNKRQIIDDVVSGMSIEYSEEIYLSLEKYIENYLKHYSEDMDKVYYEKEFYLQLDRAYISGYIDKMTIKDGKLSIIDFKTNKMYNKAKLIEEYTPQVQLYAYAASKILDLSLENASILFLEKGEKVDIAVDEGSLLKNIENIQNFIDFTRANNKINQYEKTERCSEYCKYMGICKLEER